MTAALMPTGNAAPAKVIGAVGRMKDRVADKHASMDRVRKVRQGRFNEVWPDKFNSEYPTSIVANFVDVAARDLAANLAPLPSLACSAGAMKTDADKRRADRKNRIGYNYWRHSRLEWKMKYGADQYLTYGFLPFWVEADYDDKLPFIHVEDPVGAYYELDREFECVRYAREWHDDVYNLAAQFPEYERAILRDPTKYDGVCAPGKKTLVVRYIDATQVTMYLPERGNMVIASYAHGLGFCPVHIAMRPGVEMDPRGQFDDVLWVQLAHTVMAALTLEAGHQAVQAPLAIPSDVQELPMGPNSLIVTDNPDKIRKIGIEVPAAAFALSTQLENEMHQGAGYPDTRLGVGPSGGSTGRGISALEGGYDTQIRLGQDVLGLALRIVTEMAFKLELKLWPHKAKTITGTVSGESFEMSYTPAKDIGDNTSCDVTYGFASGLSPNAAIVTMLQLRGDDLISRDTVRRQLPFDIDVDREKREILEQQMRDYVMQGVAAALQASGQMFAQGQAPEAVMFYKAAVGLVRGLRAGEDMTDLIELNLINPIDQQVQQQQQQQEAQQQAMQQAMSQAGGGGGAAPGGDPIAGVGQDGLPTNVAPSQAGLPPGGRPSIMDLTAGFTGSGKPSLGAGIRRRMAIGA